MHWEIDLKPHPSPAPTALSGFPAGLLYGYSVYTTFRYPIAERWLMAHWNRLQRDAAQLGLIGSHSLEQVRNAIQTVYQPGLPIVRLSLMADVAHYGELYTQKDIPSRLFLSMRPAPQSFRTENGGHRLKSIRYLRPLPHIKLAPIAELIHWKRQALSEGFDDLLLVNQASHISEASTANIFFMRGEGLITPDPERDGCLPGITRLQVIEAARQCQWPISTATISAGDLEGMDGAFLCNAAQGMIPVTQIDNTPLPWPDASKERFHQLHGLLSQIQTDEQATAPIIYP